MSFHGGGIGACIGAFIHSKNHKLAINKAFDILAICATPGLFFGRIANFINAELYGRTTSVSWGIIFPNSGLIARHPSQLYEAVSEGLLLFLILFLCYKYAYKEGRLFGIFLIIYSLSRFCIEFTREPDAHIGLLFMGLSMGQYLCIIMCFLGGVWFYANNKKLLS